MPSKSVGLAITGGLVAVGAVLGGVILYTSSKATEVNLTSASLVPEDAGIYFALNTDLTSSQWVNTFNLAERLGQDDPEDELKDGVEEGGLDWEDDITPFLGGDAAIYVQGINIDDINAQGAVIFRCDDAEAALDVLANQFALEDDEEYGGIEYFPFEMGFVAVIEDHLVIAFDEESLEDVIDVHNGEKGSLAGRDDFQQLRDELTRNFLGFVYLSTENLLGDFYLDDPEIREAIEASGNGDLVFQPAAWVIGAREDGFEFQAASLGEAGTVAPMLAARESRLIGMVPAEASIFVSTTDLAQTYKAIVDGAREEIDAAIAEQGEYDSLDEALRDCGSELGLASCAEVVALFDGETAFAAWFPDGTEESVEGLLLAEVDEAKAKPILERIVASEGFSDVHVEQVGGTEIVLFNDEESGEEGAYAVLDGVLLLGTAEAVKLVLSNDEAPLRDFSRYTEAVGQMPSALGTYAYLDMSKILRLAEGGIPADLDEAEEALSGLIINAVDERDVVRLNGILTIEE